MKFIQFLAIKFILLLCIKKASAICPKGSIEGGDLKTCYKFYATPADFWTARTNCQLNGGDLASILSAFQNIFVSEILQDTLSDSSMPVWLGSTKNGSSWTWTDGNPFSFTSWAKGQPSSGNCLAISPSQTPPNWYSRNCSTYLPYFCEIPTEVETFSSCPPKPTINPTNPCKQGYSFFTKWNYCYKYVNELLGFWAAENYCVSEGGHLVSIHSNQEQEFVDNLCHEFGPGTFQEPWIGFYTGGPDFSIQSLWEWTDGTEVTYSSWASGEPVKNGTDPYVGPCALMISSGNIYGGKIYWQNNYGYCDNKLNFICKQAPAYGVV